MKTIATLAFGIGISLAIGSHANAQAVSSGMLSGPSAGHKKKLAVQQVPSQSKPRVRTARRQQADPVTTGSIPR